MLASPPIIIKSSQANWLSTISMWFPYWCGKDLLYRCFCSWQNTLKLSESLTVRCLFVLQKIIWFPISWCFWLIIKSHSVNLKMETIEFNRNVHFWRCWWFCFRYCVKCQIFVARKERKLVLKKWNSKLAEEQWIFNHFGATCSYLKGVKKIAVNLLWLRYHILEASY